MAYPLGDTVAGLCPARRRSDGRQLDLADGRYEILWPDDSSRRTMIFKDGQLLQTFDQPIRGARLSSVFGERIHPVHATLRMRSGLDFAAQQGAAVEATRQGKVSFSCGPVATAFTTGGKRLLHSSGRWKKSIAGGTVQISSVPTLRLR